jgi:hypothetical protein
MPATMKRAKWIWCKGSGDGGYNLSARFFKEFDLAAPGHAELRITADSRYRVWVNGTWVNDGPGKAYPEHFTFDVYDISGLLRPGANRIEVAARHYGVGTFHGIAREPGLLAELEAGGEVVAATDASWMGAPDPALARWVPKVSCQMEPCELFDARLDARLDAEPAWQPADERFEPGAAPWRDLSARRSKPLTKIPRKPAAFRGARAVKRRPGHVCVPVTRIAHPGAIETNHRTSRPVALATTMELAEAREIDLSSLDWTVSIDGRIGEGRVALGAGTHAAVFFCANFYGHIKELGFPFLRIPGVRWGEWQVFVREESLFRDNDILWLCFEHEGAERARRGWEEAVRELAGAWPDPALPMPVFGKRVDLPREQIFLPDYTADFSSDETAGGAADMVENGAGPCAEDGGATRVIPSGECDVELCYDLGEQRCGYFDFEIVAPAGTVADLHLVEYITPEGVVQHTAEHNRNGMRFIARAGENRYTSLKRRSGRYLFLTLRGMSGPVEIRRLDLIESTADVKPVARFRCSDPDLERVWEACERTLKMGMEDTFTDCSLYEQTLWIGDARNQALYAFNVYPGAGDVSARSLELGAQSLERFPIVGCQVPSTWECLLPAWSFLWGIWVWEHYFYTGDRAFLERIFPAAMKNLEGAFGFMDERGLFSGKFWNLLEWAPMDQDHATVTHNSLLLLAAARSAERCAETLGDESALAWLRPRREALARSIDAFWEPARRSYPDAVLEDGRPSPKICQHNSALAVMSGALPPERVADARRNLLDPPEWMTRISSPFAAQFLFEALEMLGEPDAIIRSIRENYVPMIRAGATTVWETFPGSTCSPPGFPTRSHCHGWSCGPIQFLNRIVLGIRPSAPGGREFEVSPWIEGLDHASGAMPTPCGPLRVGWRREGGDLRVAIDAPEGVTARFLPNASHEGLGVTVSDGGPV